MTEKYEYMTVYGVVDKDNTPLVRHGNWNGFGKCEWSKSNQYSVWLSNNSIAAKRNAKRDGCKVVEYVLVPKDEYEETKERLEYFQKLRSQ